MPIGSRRPTDRQEAAVDSLGMWTEGFSSFLQYSRCEETVLGPPPPATLLQVLYSKLVILPCCHGTSHVACSAPKTVKHRKPAWPAHPRQGVGAVKLSRHRTVLLGAHNMAMSPNCRLFHQLPVSTNPSSIHPGPNEAGHTGRSSERPRGRQSLALTTVLQGTAYGARTKHPSPESSASVVGPYHGTLPTRQVRLQGASI